MTPSKPPTPSARAPKRLLFVAANPSVDRLIEVDALIDGAIHRPASGVVVPGGKGLNAARAAFALGARATVVAIVGGRAGDWIAERLAELGIEASLVRDTAGAETRTCLSVLDRSTGLLTEFYEPGEPIGPATWAAFETAVARELERGDGGAVVCSGSLPPGAPDDGYARIVRIVRMAREAGPGRKAASIVTVVDTHGTPLELAVAERPSIVKVNGAEAAEATGLPVTDPAGAVRAARDLIERGAGKVVVTLGAEGAVAVDGVSAWRLRSDAERGAFPVGSGDAFIAGLAIAVVAGSPLAAAAGAGMAAGIANALVPGAGILDPAAAARLLDSVELSALAI
ncbi:MAG TPA: hexose kinase [Candidatus Limnocylindrales bacterium]